MTRLVLFDLDGLLIDSEPYWQRAETELFQQHGWPFNQELCAETVGLRIDEVVDLWERRFGAASIPNAQLAQAIIDRMEEHIREDIEWLPGAVEAIQGFHNAGWTCAIASASYKQLIRAAIEQLPKPELIDAYFSAEDEVYGKPHPAVFVSAMEHYKMAPEQCVILEDSINGVIAARASSAKVVAVPPTHLFDHPAYGIAHLKLQSLENIQITTINQL